MPTLLRPRKTRRASRQRRRVCIDLFAGAGGASVGIKQATGQEVQVAINHDAWAIACHELNHPQTQHLQKSVFEPDPKETVGDNDVWLLWASPDCRHFSRAKGATPVSARIRSLAWVVAKWAKAVKPRTIIIENVREFVDWGPLVPMWKCRGCSWQGSEGSATLARKRRRCPRCESLRLEVTKDMTPDPDRKGETFKMFVARLRGYGYTVEHKNLNAADFGAPTARKRLFLVATLKGSPRWPEPTHCNPKKPVEGLPPWRPAAECIDWSLPCPSIFGREKELAENSQRRIALGIRRYVLESPSPFIVRLGQTGGNGCYANDVTVPLTTITTKAEHMVVMPHLVQVNHAGEEFRGQPMTQPMSTITGSHGMAMCVPSLIQVGYGEREGQTPRTLDVQAPLGTVVSGGGKHALVAAMLAKFRFDSPGQDLRRPMPTITAGGNAGGREAGAAHAMGLIAAHVVRFNHGDKQWSSVEEPLGTITSQGMHFGLVYAFLVKYFGTGISVPLTEPMPTATTKDRFGLVLVEIAPGRFENAVGFCIEGWGHFVIADIGLRMLDPKELMLAQGFPADYQIPGSKARRVKLIGNSVPPPLARAMVAANVDMLGS